MALSARPLSAPSGPNVSSAHMPAGGRNVASVTYAQIDEISPKAEVFADPNYNFQGFTEWMQNRRPEPPRLPASTASNFETSSTTFLHLLSQQQRDSDLNAPGGIKDGPGLQRIVNKAIRAYEGTADVIGGAMHKRGASISFSL
ncbi:hypothetical protein [Magnetovibrio sp.]|uniref:hypothetical protein n=1 Tax=Magnetovibrio sp. TaxID=2024836 RepID=UPI002F92F33E